MKLRLGGLMTALLLAAVSFAAQKGQSYTGEIMDSACAASGTHAAMTKNNPNLTAKACTTACVSHGAKYVLYDASTKTVYQLSDQKKPVKFAGDKVAVTGTLDAATKTIKVSNIKAAS